MNRMAKRPGKVRNGMCEHGFCDWCPQGCFDVNSEELKMWDEFQRQLHSRRFRAGWKNIDKPTVRYYFDQIFDSWHEAYQMTVEMNKTLHDLSMVYFVEPVPEEQ